MPPPTDPWLSSRRFGIIIDAGSSGSRLQLYSWRDARVVRTELSTAELDALPIVEKGTKDPDNWIIKTEPGLSSFGRDPEGIFKYLKPLIEHAGEEIPPHLHPETPIFLLATAGMRLLPQAQQKAVLQKVCQYFRDYTDFKVDKPSELGACGASVRIITGEEEGLFGWIAVNYLMDGFASAQSHRTYGFLDMGGASTQIAFEPTVNSDRSESIRLRLLNGKDIDHRVFVTTWLGYGTNQARQRYVGRIADQPKSSNPHIQDSVTDFCLPRGLQRTETAISSSTTSEYAHKSHILVGGGNFTRCIEESAPLLNKDAPCVDIPCLFGGKHVPTIDFAVSRFIGVSEYWYSSEQVFDLGGAYDFVQYERAANSFCSQEWSTIVAHHDKLRHAGEIGGDGEVEENGKIVGLGNWSPDVDLSRLEMQCFKAAWIVNILHEGLGMPRILDPGGNSTDHDAAHQVGQHAKDKGLKPTFQSADTVGDTAISWTLGKMVLEASKEIEPARRNTPPIADPYLPVTNFRPYPLGQSGTESTFYEDRISKHLPSLLNHELFGVPAAALIFYLLTLAAFVWIVLRMKMRLKSVTRRFLRRINLRSAPDEEIEMQDDGPVYRYDSPTSSGFPVIPAVRKITNNIFRALKSNTSPQPQPLHNPTYPNFSNGYDSDASYIQSRASSVRVRPSSRLATVSQPPSPSPYSNGHYAESFHSLHDGQELSNAASVRALRNSLSSLSHSHNSSSLSLHPHTTTASLLSRSGAQTPVHEDEYL